MTEQESNLPQLPECWAWAKIGDFSNVLGGKRLPKGHEFSEVPTAHPYVRVTDFDKMTVNIERMRFLKPETHELIKRYIISNGDVYVSIAGSIGKVGTIPDSLNGANLTENAAKITSNEVMNKKALCFALNTPFVQEQIKKSIVSTNQPKLALFRIEKLVVPVPPRQEQIRIVSKVEELLSFLDAGVDTLRKAQVQLKRYRQAVLKYAFEGKLTEEYRKTHRDQLETATKLLEQIKQERRKDPKHKELPPVNTADLSELPENWTWTRLGEIGIVASGGTPSTKIPEYFDGDVPWITPADLSDFTGKFIHRGRRNISEKGLSSSSAVLLPEGTILFSSRAPIGYVVIAANPVSTNQGFKNLILYREIFNEYVFYYLKASKILAESYGSGTTFGEVSAARFSLIPIPLASLNEQHRIVEEIEQRLSLVYETIKTIAQALIQSDRLRQSILKRAFEGRLVSQDPSDEPAENLLERIKAERARSMGEKDTNKGRKNKPKQLELSTYVK